MENNSRGIAYRITLDANCGGASFHLLRSYRDDACMSQDVVYAARTTEPQTQKELMSKLRISSGVLCHMLNRLAKKGMVQVVRLETRYRPNGYVRVS